MGSHEVIPLSDAEKAAARKTNPVGHCPLCKQFDADGLVYLQKDLDELRKTRDKDEGTSGAADPGNL
jgi:hypothetical protein